MIQYILMHYQVGGKMDKIILINKKASNHYYYFNKLNGLSIRKEHEGYDDPFWSVEGPELLDISITNFCEKGCSFCYKNSSANGKHMAITDYENILNQLKTTHTYQVALGGGNPNQHPDFCEILRMTREDYGIIPSYTTNGYGLTDDIIYYSKKYCGAVAVSYYEPLDEFEFAIRKLIDNGIKTNVHFLLTSLSLNAAIGILEYPPAYMSGINSIIFLNYKPVGNHSDDSLLLKKNDKVNEFFNLVKKHNSNNFKIGFDSCTISGIVTNLYVNKIFIDSCEAGRFSAYISEEMKLYPCSFMESASEPINLRKTPLLEAWQNGFEFNKIRKSINNNACINNCDLEKICNGGCPVFREINLCSK